MKSYVSESESPTTKPFPKLMCKGTLVVLFTDDSTGMVVTDGMYGIGHYSDDWLYDHFSDFHGSVTLSSED